MKSSRIAVIAMMAVGCSELDPNVGQWRVELGSDAATDDGGAAEGGDDAEPPGTVSFRDDIRPLMNRGPKDVPRGCASCHYASAASHLGVDLGGLNLETLGTLRMGGGSSGTRIVIPGKPDESILVQVLKGQYQYANQMPKGGKTGYWADDDVKLVAKWIAEGARGRNSE
jgi:hypothetical protein